MEKLPDSTAGLYGHPNDDIKIELTPEQEAKRRRTNQEVMEANSVWIDGEWVSLGC